MKYNLIHGWIYRYRTPLLFSIVLMIGIFLRFYDLGTESIWLDEAASLKESVMSIQGMVASSNQPPLYFLILRGWTNLFGISETAIRSLSAIFGVLTIVLVFLVGKSLINTRVALIGAFLTSLAAFPIQYSQDARGYSLLLMLSLLAYWFFVEILKKNTPGWYLAYIIACLLVSYTHFFGLFIISSQMIYIFIFFRRYKLQRWKYFGTLAILIIALIPLGLLLKNNIRSLASNGFWIPEPGIGSLLNNLALFSGIGSVKNVLFVIFVMLAILGFFTLKRVESQYSQQKSKKRRDIQVWQIQPDSPEITVLLLLWLFIPILIPFVESRLMTPIYQAKYAIGAFPALCLLVAKGLSNIKWQWIFYILLIVIVVLSSIGLGQYYKYDVKEQWREVVQLVDSKSKQGDVIVFCEEYYNTPFDYYYQGDLQQTGFNNLEGARKFVDSEGKIITGKSGRIWLLLAYNKTPIIDYFVNTYGQSSVTLAERYTGITVILLDLSIRKK
jgi:mannosyltransferase